MDDYFNVQDSNLRSNGRLKEETQAVKGRMKVKSLALKGHSHERLHFRYTLNSYLQTIPKETTGTLILETVPLLCVQYFLST
jgi:hypothetical protein